MNLLVVRLSSLGDIVLVTPCLRALRRHWPEARITLAVNRDYADLPAFMPEVDRAMLRRQRGRVRRWKTALQAIGARRREPGPRFDLALDLQGNAHSALWTQLSGARRKAGLAPGRRGWEFRAPLDQTRHAIDLAAGVLERLGVAVTDRVPRLTVPEEQDAGIAALLAARGLPAHGYIVLHPFAAWASKQWPIERYAEVIRAVSLDEESCPAVLVTGSADEADRADALCRHAGVPRAVSLAGRLTLAQSLALWGRARLFLGGDTGAMHASAALGVPVVALFGPTLPEVSGPVGPRHRVVQAVRPPGQTAYRDDPDGRHIRAIGVDVVLAALREAMRATR